MQAIKKPAVSGAFYPSDPKKLKQTIAQHMHLGFKVPFKPKAIIAPHAGYIYSGNIAGSAYSPLPFMRDNIKQVVLLGPAHRHPVNSFAVSSAQAFETPLGQIPIQQGIIKQLLEQGMTELNDEAFAKEHSLEVQLPFLQYNLKQFHLIPILVGHPPIEKISALLKTLYGDKSTLIVISSDLSHYLDYQSANQIDMLTSQQITALNYEAIQDHQACGRYPLKGLMHLSLQLGLTARTIDLKNSGDTQGNPDRVVGYGAYHFYEPDEKLGFYSNAQRHYLKQVARETIIHGLDTGEFILPSGQNSPFEYSIQKATFVTLEKNGHLRGCIGSLNSHQILIDDVATNAFKAAFKDHRFPPLTKAEANQTKMNISILSDPESIIFQTEDDLIKQLRPSIDGLIIEDQNRRAIFLPSVWESIKTPQDFLRQLKIKAGLSADHWSNTFSAQRFIADKF